MEDFNGLSKLLLSYRNFNGETYIKEKTNAINNFFRTNDLDSCVLGISGGIDSAVVFKLLKLASEQDDSPIKLIKTLILPIVSDGTSGQSDAITFGEKAIDVYDGSCTFDLTQITNSYTSLFPGIEPWTIGQIASIIRTPMLYGQAAHLQQLGYRSIVCGTTNRDEGSYIGFFGKSSDAMVDLQPIADIHKTEVIEIARLLGVPTEIIERTPTGDVFDASSDEDTIGAPYWFIQLYLLHKEYSTLLYGDKVLNMFEEISDDDFQIWEKYGTNIELLHMKNSHKYKVGMPSHFIDVIERRIPGGW